MLPRVRAVSLFNYIEIAASVGLDPYLLLRDAQIDPALLAHPENWLGARPVGDLLERSARDSDRDDFALLLAECRTFASLGPISLVLKHQETLGQVIARLQEYRTRLNDVIGLALAVSEDVAIVQWTVVPEFAGPQIECLVSAVGYRALTEAMGRSWKPECVHFAMARPVEIQSYQRFFQCDLHFGAPFNGLSFNAGQLDIRNRGSDPALAQHAERLLKLIPAPEESVTDKSRHALYLLLPAGRADLVSVARNLGIGCRSLQRELEVEGTTFGALLRETRRELALRYVSANTHRVGEVAHLVGYSSPGSFSRWFAGEFGTTPLLWRAQHRK